MSDVQQARKDPDLDYSSMTGSRSMERFIGALFVVSFLATIGLGVTFWLGGQPQVEGALLFVALVGIGVGIVAWGKYLTPHGPYVQDRHDLRSSDLDREAFYKSLERGNKVLGRRSFLGKMLGVSLGAFAILQLFPFLRSLGPVPGKSLYLTDWKHGSQLTKVDGSPVLVSDLEVGGAMTVFPEGFIGNAVDQVILVRPGNYDIVTRPGRETWGPQGYLAFSKVCTHAGCPVGLYQELTQQLLCPCHQSLFDVLTGATPVFGPAPRPLPQLPIYVDAEGVIRSQSGFNEPIGPGFWERGNE
jgi:ubiquinol-cytochrome c reductase iron-sulfur subunit